MTLKELSQLYYLNREIERDKARLDELYSKATGCTQTITGMPHVPGVTDKVDKYAAEIADLRGIIEANIQRCFYELNRLNRFIENVDDARMRMILSLRFVNGLTWRQVAHSIGGGNTEDSVRKACQRFLQEQDAEN